MQTISSLSRIIFFMLISLVLERMLTYTAKDPFIVDALLLIAVAVRAHSNRTESVPFSWKSETILSSLGFWLGSYLHFVLRILRMANCKISPISSTDWLLIWVYKYSIAFFGLLLLSRIKAFRLVDRSVSFLRSSSISSSIYPMISAPKCMKILYRHITAFLRT